MPEDSSGRARALHVTPACARDTLSASTSARFACASRHRYFHRNSVLHGGFERLRIGSKVRFIEEPGEKGPQASTVTLLD